MKVSVIVPVYNVEKYLVDCLDSICAQSFREMEILCIEDGSTDGSLQILKEYAKKDERILVHEHGCNKGLAAVRNTGLSLATGEYVYFLDSDDMITVRAIETMVSAAEKEHLDALVFEAAFVFEDEGLREKFQKDPSVFKGDYPGVYSGKELFVQWMEVWDWISMQQRYLFRKSFLDRENIRFIEGMVHEDETFSFDVMMHANRIQVMHEPLLLRRFRHNSIMSEAVTMRNVNACMKILQHVSTCYREEKANAVLNRAIKHYQYKIFRNVCGKLRAVMSAENAGLLPECNEENEVLFDIIESIVLWEDV